ncbi:MAG: DUF4458 domain-containing protein [Bacteroides sp.]|nr:DUF4458 domain-containing protein [Bacteroides sp.]
MNHIHKSYFKTSLPHLIVSLLAMLVVAVGCSDDKDDLQGQYGYVQFKLYKSASYSNTETTRASNALDLLADAQKLEIVMQYNNSTISQSLVLNSYNAENSEYGLRSDKLQLLTGEYTIIGFRVYDKLDQQLLSGDGGSNNTFSVVEGGMTVHDLTISVSERGLISFKLVKDLVQSRAEGASYPFGNIKAVDVMLKNLFTQEVTTIKSLKVTYTEDFADGSADEERYPNQNAETSYATCDSVMWLAAGNYSISGYTTYSDKNAKNALETASVSASKTFTVKDNAETEIEVPIRLSETAEYIKDYLALRTIWESLGGEKWSYVGEANAIGCNWYFNKDIDMWGDQPGVSLDSDGRVSSLNLSGFGINGVMPDAIGQLTELRVLNLGTHEETLGGHLFDEVTANMTAEELNTLRMDYAKRFLDKSVRSGLSEILQQDLKREEPTTTATTRSAGSHSSQPITRADVQSGVMTNNLTGISKAIMRLTELQQLYIANSPITVDKFFRDIEPTSEFYAERDQLSWENLDGLTDIEIYNCSKLTGLPMEMLSQLPGIQILNIANNTGISGEQLKADWEALIDGKSGTQVQGIYMGYNNLEEFPDYSYLSRMTKLGLLDCTNNKIKKVHPFGKGIQLTKFYLDHNQIEEIEPAEDGYFFGYDDVESFTCTYNKLTQVPDIFNARIKYIIGEVSFAYNQITGFENGDSYKGINASEIDLSYNQLEEFPGVLFSTGSPISILNLQGNGMKTIPEGSLQGSKAHYLVTLDLSFNKLTDLPEDFLPETLPYLYGLELSYNCFSSFPVLPLNIDRLTVLGIRHQRDENGNRCLREWPTGLYQCPSLIAFYIGSNDLRKIDDTISPYIRIFEIKDNPNISIDMSTPCAYIASGYYTLIYDKTQDIRGCSSLDLE